MTANKTEIYVDKNDVFDYIIGNTNIDAIERSINRDRFEVRNDGIYDWYTKETIPQSEEYTVYCQRVSILRQQIMESRRCFSEIDATELQNQCNKIAAKAPKEIFLPT